MGSIIAARSSSVRDLERASLSCNRRKPFQGKDAFVSEDMHEAQSKHDDSEDYVERIMKETNGITDDGDPIDREVLKKYIQEIKESEGFVISDFPGCIEGVTNIFPLQAVLDDRKRCPDDYDEIMYLATLAVAAYNKKHGTQFKVVEIEKLNVECRRNLDYYITFGGVDVKGRNKQPSLFDRGAQCIVMLIRLLCLLAFVFSKKKMKLKREMNLKKLKASEHELRDNSAVRKTFQALVTDNLIDRKQEVSFCRVL